MRTPDKNTIDNVASAVFDNGRRGAPRPGCDCVQCFGYCQIDKDAAMRYALACQEDVRAVRDMALAVEFTDREERE
jgi:hypothetical protein